MASDVLKYALIAGAGYLAYEFLVKPSTAAPAPASGSAPFSLSDLIAALRAPAPATTTPPAGAATTSLADQLTAAAAGNAYLIGGKMTADQWSYIYNHLSGKASIDSVFDALFFPNGRPTDQATYPTYTAAEFAAALKTKGISGLGGVRTLARPLAVRGPDGRMYIMIRSNHPLSQPFVPVGVAR